MSRKLPNSPPHNGDYVLINGNTIIMRQRCLLFKDAGGVRDVCFIRAWAHAASP